MKRYLRLLSCLLLLFHCLSAQHMHIRNYSKTDGLPGIMIFCIHQDSKGYLWFGTKKGLSRFNGVRFKNFTAKEGAPANIITMAEDRTGTLWLGTMREGIYCFREGVFSKRTPEQIVPKASVYSIVTDAEGTPWFGTGNGLFHFDGNCFTQYTARDGLPSDQVKCLDFDGDGNLWMAVTGGISCFNGNGFTNITA
ncbi:MAG: hypothetical protein GY765_17560, partial [bacterium]|nr:hypothetical protein [bacterium]